MAMWGRRSVVITAGDRDPEVFIGGEERAVLRALIERRLKEGGERSGTFQAPTCTSCLTENSTGFSSSRGIEGDEPRRQNGRIGSRVLRTRFLLSLRPVLSDGARGRVTEGALGLNDAALSAGHGRPVRTSWGSKRGLSGGVRLPGPTMRSCSVPGACSAVISCPSPPSPGVPKHAEAPLTGGYQMGLRLSSKKILGVYEHPLE